MALKRINNIYLNQFSQYFISVILQEYFLTLYVIATCKSFVSVQRFFIQIWGDE